MATSPNTLNYQMSLGSLSIQLDGEGSMRHVGNVPSMTYAPDIEFIEHKQAMAGIQSTDFKRARTVKATINVTMEEITPENLALFAMGTTSAATSGGTAIGGLTESVLEGDLQFIGANSIGQMIDFTARVSITPSGEFNFISDDLNTIEVEMEVLQSGGEFGHWELREQATA